MHGFFFPCVRCELPLVDDDAFMIVFCLVCNILKLYRLSITTTSCED